MSFSTFKLSPAPLDAFPITPSLDSCPGMSVPAFKVSDQSHVTPTTASGMSPTNFRGTFDWALANGYNLEWSSQTELDMWLQAEEEQNTIELIRKEVRPNKTQSEPTQWTEHHFYICGCAFTGGQNRYKKKHSWTRKVPVKRIGCPCRLTVAFFSHTNTILGKYNNMHSHEIGSQNTRFTRLPKSSRKEIERLLRLGVEPKKVVSEILSYLSPRQALT